MNQLKVNEMFFTLQGEGFWSGTPATFIRLQGCPVGCPWCDTKHTWPDSDRKRVSAEDMLNKTEDAPTWAALSPEEVVAAALDLTPLTRRHFVITGGEPCQQDIYELTVLLGREGRVQLETSGTHPINVAFDTWVTVSPKIDMPGGFDVLADALDRANEIKMPVESQRDIDKLLTMLVDLTDRYERVTLAPVSLDPDATALCIVACMQRGWRLSLQTHKLTGLR